MVKWLLRGMLALVLGVMGLVVFTDNVKAANCTWINVGGGDWGTEANWTDCGSKFPTSNDTATIALNVTVTVNADAVVNRLTITQGTVTVNSGINLNADTIELQGGELTGAGNNSVKTLNWSGGTLSGTGTTQVDTKLSMSNSLHPLLNRTISMANAATWDVAADGSVSGTGILNISGTVTRNGSGTLSISGISITGTGGVDFSTKSTTISGPYVLSGTTTVRGTDTVVTINYPAGSSVSGPFTVTTPAKLNFGVASGILTFGTGDNLSGTGTVEFNSGTVNISSNYTLSGTTIVSGAGTVVTITYPANSSISGPFAVNTPANLIFTVASGTLTFGTGDNLSGDGTVEFNSGAVNISSNYTLSGTTIVSGAGTVVTITYPANSSISGPFTVNTPAKLNFGVANGTLTFGTGDNLSGDGTVEFQSGTVNIQSTYNVSGTTGFSGATVNFTSTAVLTSLGTNVYLSTGTLNLDTGKFSTGTPLSVSSLTMTGGTLTGADSLAITTFDWSGGAMSGTGQTRVNNTLSMSGSMTLTGRTLLLASGGMATWTGAGTLSGSSGLLNIAGTLERSGTGAMDVTEITLIGEGLVQFSSASTNFSGTYNMNGTTGTTTVSGGTLDLSSATLTLTSLGQTLNLSGGTLNLGTKTVLVPNFTWSGGTLSGDGPTSVTNHLALSGTLMTLTGRTLTNNGTTTATWIGDSTLSGTGTFINATQLTKSGFSTQSILSTTGFSNTGTINVASGRLVLNLPASPNSTGTFSAGTGAFLNLAGAHSFASSSVINGLGTVEFPSGAVSVSGGYEVTGTTIVSGADLNLSDSTLLAITGSSLNLTLGSLNLGTKSVTLAALGLSGGNLTSANSLTTSTLNWSGGTLSGAGTTTVTTTLAFSGNPVLTNQALVNTGAATWTAAGTLTGSGTATFRNSGGGTLAKSGTGTAALSGIAFANTSTGAVSVSGGTLALDLSSTVHSTGPYSAGAGEITFSGDHTFDNGAGIGGAGTVTFNSGTYGVNGLYTVSGTTVVNGGSTQVTVSQLPASTAGMFSINAGSLIFTDANPCTFAVGANFSGTGRVEFQSGTYTVNSNLSLSAGGSAVFTSGTVMVYGTYDVLGTTLISAAAVNLSTGTVSHLGGTLAISGGSLALGASDSVNTFNWSGGTLSGTGTTTVSTNLVLSGTLALNNRTLVNNGTATWNTSGSTTGVLTGTGTAALQNNSGGTFTRSGSNTIVAISGPVFSNAGTVNVSVGTLDLGLSAGISSSGPYNVSPGAALRFAGPHTFAAGGTISGDGAIEFYSGTISINNNYAPVGTTGISGAGTVVTVNYPASSSGTGAFSVVSGTLVLNGNHTFTSGTTISGAGTIRFGASSISIDGDYALTGATIIEGAATSVEIIYPSNASASGPFTVNSPAKLSFSVPNSTLTFGAGANLNAAGTLEFKSGSAVVNSNYAVTGTTIVSGAALDLSGSTLAITGSNLTLSAGSVNLGAKTASIATLNVSGGDLTGTNLLTAQNLNWSGGTMTGSGTTSVSANLGFSGTLTLTERILSNSGSATWTAAGGLSGTGTFNNLNLLTKTGSGTLTTLSTTGFSNSGTINVVSGTLAINLPALPNSTGTYTAGSGAFLNLSGAHSFAAPSVINGAGTVEFPSGSVIVNGGYAVTGTTMITGAALNLSNSSLAIPGSSLNLSSGSVLLGSKTASIAALILSGGELSGTNLITTQTLNWSGGTMSGSGTTEVALQWNIVGNPILTNRTLVLDSAAIANWPSDGSISGTGTLINRGSFIKAGVGTTSTISGITFRNELGGSVNVNSGTLAIGLPAAFASVGPYTVADNATLNFNGGHTFGVFANISGGGTVNFQSGTVAINSIYNLSSLTGTTQISGADVNMAGATITSLGANLVISGGSLNLGSSNASLVSMNWSAGTISGSALLSVNGALTMIGNLVLTDLTLDSNGTATWTSASTISGSGKFNNAGSLTKTGTGTTSSIRVAVFSNSGSIIANQGSLEITPISSATSSGNYVSNGSAAIIFSGTHTFTPAASIGGSSNIEFRSGTVNFQGAFDVSGTTTISGAIVNLIPSAALTNLGANVTLSAGTLNISTGLFPVGSPFTVSSLTMSGGVLTGSDSLLIPTFNWSSGVLSGGGNTIVPVGGALNFTGTDSLILDTRILTNNGSVTWNRSNGFSYLYFANHAQFTNTLSGTFSLQNSGLYVFLGSGTFLNNGAFIKNNPESVEISGIIFTNSGSLVVKQGSFQIFFTPSTSSTGSYSVDPGASLIFTGDHTFTVGSSIGGGGSLRFTFGSIAISGTYQASGSTSISGASVNLTTATLTNLGAVLNVSAGSLNLGAHNPTIPTVNLTGGEIIGTDTLTVGTLTWSDGSMTGSGTTAVSTLIDFNGTTPLILNQRSLVNHGIADWNNSGYLYLSNNAVIINDTGATMNLKTAISYVIYGTGILQNDGILNFTLGKIDVTTFRQSAGAALNMDIKGPVIGNDYGQLSVKTAELNGALHIEFKGYTPGIGKHFTLLQYTTSPAAKFATTQIIDHLPPNTMDWQLTYKETGLDLWTQGQVFQVYLPSVLK